MLELAIVRPVINRMAMPAAAAPTPLAPKPMRSTCGIGPIRLIWSTGTNASTALVPRMNMTAMMGAAISVARPIDSRRILRFTSEDRDVLEPAQRTHRHLSEHVQAEERQRRHGDGERMIIRQRASRHVNERQRDQRDEREHEHHAARVVDPLAHAKSDARPAPSAPASRKALSTMMNGLLLAIHAPPGPDDI